MVYILLGDGFEETEAIVPADLLRRAGIEVSLVGLNGLHVTGGHGIVVTADVTLEQVRIEDMELLVLPGGGGGVESILMDLFATALIQKAWDHGCYLAAICAAPLILAHMGILDRRKAVCYPGSEKDMGSAVLQQGHSVVVDGRIVTAQAAGSAFPFGLKLIELLSGEATAKQMKDAIHYQD